MTDELETILERRPDAAGRNTATYPADWGPAPALRSERVSWIRMNILRGEKRRARGEKVPWLAEGKVHEKR